MEKKPHYFCLGFVSFRQKMFFKTVMVEIHVLAQATFFLNCCSLSYAMSGGSVPIKEFD